MPVSSPTTLGNYRKPHLLSVETLVEDDADGPHVHFGGDLWRVLAHDEALGRQIPIGPGALRGEVHPVVRVVVLRIHDLGEAKVRDLDVPTDAAAREQDVACRSNMSVNHKRYVGTSFYNLPGLRS